MFTAVNVALVDSDEINILGAVTIYFRDELRRERNPPPGSTRKKVSYEKLAARYRVSKTWVWDLLNDRGSVGPELEQVIAEHHHDGSVDELRRFAVEHALGQGYTVIGAELYEPEDDEAPRDDYETREDAIRRARARFNRAIRQVQSMRFKSESGDKDVDPGEAYWEAQIEAAFAAQRALEMDPDFEKREAKKAAEDTRTAIRAVKKARQS